MNAAKEYAAMLLREATPTVDVERWLAARFQGEGHSPLEALELVDARLSRVVESADEILLASDERGVPSGYEWQDSSRRVLVRRRAERADVRGAIVNSFASLSGTEFELVVGELLTYYGAKRVTQTGALLSKRQGDEEFDLVALSTIQLGHDARPIPVRLAVSCKSRPSGTVDPGEVRAFASSLNKLRRGPGDALIARLPGWYREAADPVVGVFATTGRLTEAARRICVEETVLWLEGDQIADDLTSHVSADSWLTPAGIDGADLRRRHAA